MEFLIEYGLFMAKTVTVVVAIGIILLMIVATRRRGRETGELHVQPMNERFARLENVLKHRVLPKKRFRKDGILLRVRELIVLRSPVLLAIMYMEKTPFDLVILLSK